MPQPESDAEPIVAERSPDDIAADFAARQAEREAKVAEANAKLLEEFQVRLARAKETAAGLVPLGDRVVVLRLLAAEQSAGGILIPEDARGAPCEGEVLRVAADVTKLAAGERVIFSSYSGLEVKVDGTTFLVLSEGDVVLVRRGAPDCGCP